MPIKNWKADADAKKAQTSNGAVKMLWTDKYFYILVTADDPELDFGNAAPYNQDSVEIFFDEHNYKEEYGKHNEFQYRLVCNSQPAAGADPVGKFTEKSFWDGKDIESAVAKTDTGYACEFAIPLNDVPVEDQFAGVEVQINDASGGERNGTWNLFANPAAGDPVPYESTTVFGDCQYIIKREPKVIELTLDSEHCNMEKPDQFKNNAEYDKMNSESRIDDENKWIYCNTANNLTVYFPEGRTVLNGEKAEVSIKGVYTASDTDTEETALFRIWMADSKQRTLVGDSPVTTSNQESVSVGTLNAGSDGEFEVNTTLIACEGSTDEGATSDGTCDAVMIKAPSWDAMIGDIIIKSVVITVYDPVEYVEPGKEPGEDEPSEPENIVKASKFTYDPGYKTTNNDDGSVTVEGLNPAQGHDIVVPVPNIPFNKIVIHYRDYVKNGDAGFSAKFGKVGENAGEGTNQFGWGTNIQDGTTTTFTFTEEQLPIDQMMIFSFNSGPNSHITLESVEFIQE